MAGYAENVSTLHISIMTKTLYVAMFAAEKMMVSASIFMICL